MSENHISNNAKKDASRELRDALGEGFDPTKIEVSGEALEAARKEVEELTRETDEFLHNASLRETEDIIGSANFLGPDQIREVLKLEKLADPIPKIPFTTRELLRAQELEQQLVLRLSRIPATIEGNNVPLSVSNMLRRYGSVELQTYPDNDGYRPSISNNTPRSGWALIKKNPIQLAPGETIHDEYHKLIEYLEKDIYSTRKMVLGKTLGMPTKIRDLIKESRRSSESYLAFNKLVRPTPAEALYDLILISEITGKKIPGGDILVTGTSTHRVSYHQGPLHEPWVICPGMLTIELVLDNGPRRMMMLDWEPVLKPIKQRDFPNHTYYYSNHRPSP